MIDKNVKQIRNQIKNLWMLKDVCVKTSESAKDIKTKESIIKEKQNKIKKTYGTTKENKWNDEEKKEETKIAELLLSDSI